MKDIAIESILEILQGCEYEVEIKNDFIHIRWTDGPDFKSIIVYMSLYRDLRPCRVMREDSKTGKKQVLKYVEIE